MSLPRLSLCLSALAGPLLAQSAPLPVDDLVGTDIVAASRLTRQFVQRTFHASSAHNGNSEGDGFAFHHIDGSGALAPWGSDFGNQAEPSGLLSDDDLEAAVAALSGSRESELAVIRNGRSYALRSDYPEQAAAALTELRGMLPGAIRIEVMLSRIDAEGEEVLIESSRVLRSPRPAVFGDVTQHTGIADFDVEIAQSAATANPVTLEYNRGATVAVRARHLPFHNQAILETLVRVSRSLESEPMQVHRDFGELDRMAANFSEAAFTLRVEPGSSTVQEWTASDGDTMRLTLATAWRQPTPVGAGRPQVVASNLLGPPLLGFRYGFYGDREQPIDALYVSDLLQSLGIEDTTSRFVTGNPNGGGMFILPAGRESDIARRNATRQLDRHLQPIQIELEAFAAPRGVQLTGDALPDDLVRLGRIAAHGIAGLPMSFGGGNERAHLRDHDVEVAQAARVPDPKVGMIETGWFATLTLHSAPTGGRPRLDVQLDASRLIELERRELTINAAQLPQTETSPTPVLPQDLIVIELPEVAEAQVRAELELDENGRGVFHSSSRALLGPDRQLVLRARLR